MKYLWIELKRMLKDYKKLILSFGLLIGFLLFGLLTYRDIFQKTEQPEVLEAEPSALIDSENDSRLAFFRFYVEKPDSNPFTNHAVLTFVFNGDEVVDKLYQETQVDINETKESLLEMGISDFNPIEVRIDDSSSILTAVFDTGDNGDNLEIADFYYTYLFNGDIPMLQNMMIYPLSEPKLTESEPKLTELQEEELGPITVEQESINLSFILSILFNFIISMLLGLIVVTGLVILKELFSSTLNYSFGYDNISDDQFMIYDNKLNNKEKIRFFIGKPFAKTKLILSENELEDIHKNILADEEETSFSLSGEDTMYFDEKNNLEETSLHTDYEEVILVVQSTLTSRKWYNNQLEALKTHKKPIKIVQINVN